MQEKKIYDLPRIYTAVVQKFWMAIFMIGSLFGAVSSVYSAYFNEGGVTIYSHRSELFSLGFYGAIIYYLALAVFCLSFFIFFVCSLFESFKYKREIIITPQEVIIPLGWTFLTRDVATISYYDITSIVLNEDYISYLLVIRYLGGKVYIPSFMFSKKILREIYEIITERVDAFESQDDEYQESIEIIDQNFLNSADDDFKSDSAGR